MGQVLFNILNSIKGNIARFVVGLVVGFTSIFFSSIVFAQAAGAGAQPGVFEQVIVPFGFVFLIFYFLIIRPQGKRQKKLQSFLGSLKRGDAVLTASGIYGTIEGLTEQFVTLEVSEGVRIKMLKAQVAGPASDLNQSGQNGQSNQGGK